MDENLFARHSVAYEDLAANFMGFPWITDGQVRSWDDTLARFQELGVTPLRQLHRGAFHDTLIEDTIASLDMARQEGFVVRVQAGLDEADMPRQMGKYTRANHVQSDVHWMAALLVPNKLG